MLLSQDFKSKKQGSAQRGFGDPYLTESGIVIVVGDEWTPKIVVREEKFDNYNNNLNTQCLIIIPYSVQRMTGWLTFGWLMLK